MPNPADVAEVLEECVALLRKYAGSTHGAACDRRLLSEFHGRLVKLQFAFARITELVPASLEVAYQMAGWRVDKVTGKVVEKFDPTANRNDKVALDRVRRIESELFILTEWFYHTAWRLREIVHPKACPLPGLAGFEAIGVRDVRNQILQHPEKFDLNRQSESTAVSDVAGPMLGNAFWEPPETPFNDRGLYYNALEFATNLRVKLDAATK
jgi:hypothetical protein